MADLPKFSNAADTARDAADAVRGHGRTLIPWLPDPPECGRCGALMYAGVTFDRHMVDYVECWKCRDCGRQIYRNDPGPEPERPGRGAPAIREMFSK